jgi:uncharacterized coiled-coil protein SlyX
MEADCEDQHKVKELNKYSKGQQFTVDQTAATVSRITITLHKVVNGNYESNPITEQEFGATNPP